MLVNCICIPFFPGKVKGYLPVKRTGAATAVEIIDIVDKSPVIHGGLHIIGAYDGEYGAKNIVFKRCNANNVRGNEAITRRTVDDMQYPEIDPA